MLYLRWAAIVPLVILMWPVARIVGTIATIQMVLTDQRVYAPVWARLFAPFDHSFTGANVDPMWRRWWETDEGTGREWYCKLLKRWGIRSTSHGLVIWLQWMRNGGGTANYTLLGVQVSKEHDLTGEDGNYDLWLGGKRVAFRRKYRWLGGETWIGWMINRPFAGHAKHLFYPWRK